MSLASDSDLWMFVTSGGGLTAGRVDADGALFPYETVDRLHDAHHHTGPITLLRVARPDGATVLWEPFTAVTANDAAITRRLAKSALGNSLVFEEIARVLGLALRYRWSNSDAYGWVRTTTLENMGDTPVSLMLLDGLRNILPYGAPVALYQQASVLVDAYKTAEVDPDTGLGVFALTAGITDRAEALEVLRASTVWCHGLEGGRVHLDGNVVAAFRAGRVLPAPPTLHGARGNYLVSATLTLAPGASAQWLIAADSGRDHRQVAALRQQILGDPDIDARVRASIAHDTEQLRDRVASADGLQLTRRPEVASHHLANVLFNGMRGGVFVHGHSIPMADLRAFLAERGHHVAARHDEALAALPATIPAAELRRYGLASGDPDLARLCHEYLPLYFGRRHGDPSRPWNRFAIRVRGADGERELNFEGNWRDIFQNWEALCLSFPGFLPHIVARFVNASTVDGFNPYRITRDGVDWEVVSPDDPWGNIGYWGDHQLIYLVRLLELLNRHDPDALGSLLTAGIFSYADVPYRIRPYAEILANPRETIDFDTARAARVDARVAQRGADGKLVVDRDGAIRRATLLEKLLVPALAKLSQLIPDAGIWMTTQRPEWNDANNALAGGGVSVVTLCHLRRYLAFVADLLEREDDATVTIPVEIADWLAHIEVVLVEHDALAANVCDPRRRKQVMDVLGEAFSDYRTRVYDQGFTGETPLASRRVAALCRAALPLVERSIASNRREDGLYHTYNLLAFSDDGCGVAVVPLGEMLEGQVAVLDAGVLDAAEARAVLDALFVSQMYRPDQHSFMLYPARDLPGFLARNQVPGSRVQAVPLLAALLEVGDVSVLSRDADGILRFQADLATADDLAAALDALAEQAAWADAVARDRTAVIDLYETVFAHRSYTGRSGYMYAYEGVGCIYWHMVAKLLLAVQTTILRTADADAPDNALVAHYFRIRAGLGYEKSVREYGAFPTDPYSHTPASGGAKQPGMTGQVKEEILSRFGELGVEVARGLVRYRPRLLRADEVLQDASTFFHHDADGTVRPLVVPAGGLAFTHCQVPVVYEPSEGDAWIEVAWLGAPPQRRAGCALDAAQSAALLARDGHLAHIRVGIPRRFLHA